MTLDRGDHPLVTIVTPCLNRAPYLEDVVSSVADQTYEPIEHIVVDGDSTDGSQNVLHELEQRYTFRWISEPDEGMYSAINKGLALANGDVLAYLNTDDMYLPWTVEVAVKTFLQHPRAGLLYGDLVIVEESSRGVALSFYPPFDPKLLARSGFLGQPTVFFRRSLWERLGGFDESLRLVADCDYWLRAGLASSVLKVDEILAVQRDHPETLRSSHRAALEEEIRSVRSRYTRVEGIKARLLRTVDRLRLFIDRRYRLWLFLRAHGRHRRDPGYDGSWSRFLNEAEAFTISRSHIAMGLIPLAGRRMLFRMGQARNWMTHPAPDGSWDP